MKIIHEDVFILSTMDPDISAAVSPAKVNWNAANRIVGIVPVTSSIPIPIMRKFAGAAISPCRLVSPNANEYP